MLFFLRKVIEALLPCTSEFSGIIMVAGVVLRRHWVAVTGVVTLYVFSTQFTADDCSGRSNAFMNPRPSPIPPMPTR